MSENVIALERVCMDDVPSVGGKNASLGEMIGNLGNLGVQVPGGFATTADAFNRFLAADGLDQRIHAALDALDPDDVNELARVGGETKADCVGSMASANKVRNSSYEVRIPFSSYANTICNAFSSVAVSSSSAGLYAGGSYLAACRSRLPRSAASISGRSANSLRNLLRAR